MKFEIVNTISVPEEETLEFSVDEDESFIRFLVRIKSKKNWIPICTVRKDTLSVDNQWPSIADGKLSLEYVRAVSEEN